MGEQPRQPLHARAIDARGLDLLRRGRGGRAHGDDDDRRKDSLQKASEGRRNPEEDTPGHGFTQRDANGKDVASGVSKRPHDRHHPAIRIQALEVGAAWDKAGIGDLGRDRHHGRCPHWHNVGRNGRRTDRRSCQRTGAEHRSPAQNNGGSQKGSDAKLQSPPPFSHRLRMMLLPSNDPRRHRARETSDEKEQCRRLRNRRGFWSRRDGEIV